MFTSPDIDTGLEHAQEDAAAPRTKQAIIEAGVECVRRFGIRRTTMEEVARKAGLSRSAVYRYFPDKDALIDQVLLENGHRVRRSLDVALEHAASFTDKVAAAAELAVRPSPDDLLLDLGRVEPEALALMLTVHARPWIERATNYWVVHVRSAQSAGEVRPDLDARQTAEWVARSLYSLAIIPTVTIDRDESAQVRSFAITFLIGGLRPLAPAPQPQPVNP